MTQIPSGTKFVGISSTVPTPENRSAQNNSTTEIYTIDDVVETVEAGLPASPTTTTVNISSAQILAMGSSPIELLPAPGVGKYYLIDSVIIEYTYVTTPYTQSVVGGDLLSVVQSNGSWECLFSDTILTATENKWVYLSGKSSDAQDHPNQTSLVFKWENGTNGSLNLRAVSGGNPTDGDGTMRVIITYTERTFGA